ncbi:hypothetical protein [Mangrovimonas sp. TPBH4]|uniref:hypothetical protein n=1 Tax=Mangrovimonas sp. TPBH4 TaxID=1645914 RepID=UPI0006B4E686|nr:hypothetical protein [Mangrovimonas sp. TPBH4]
MVAYKTYVIVIFALGGMLSMTAQETLTPKEKERMANKVEVFTPDEKDNIQMWFYEQTNKMGLDEKTRNTYAAILSDHIYDVGRLNDKDKDYTYDEILERIDSLSKATHTKVQPLLTERQYQQHLANYNVVIEDLKKHLKGGN